MLMVMIQTIEDGTKQPREELEVLLFRIADGDKQALTELYDRTRGAVYAMALSILKNVYDAQDITQDAFVQIWDNAHRYRGQGSPMAWILTVTRNLAKMKLRRDTKLTD